MGELEEANESVLGDLFGAIPVPGERGEKTNQRGFMALHERREGFPVAALYPEHQLPVRKWGHSTG
jgi:hypothetical protein